MDDRNSQVGWTEAQWNRVREEVIRAWQSVRVAGSLLPAYGGLPRSTQVVPSEMFNTDGSVDERSTSPLLEIALPVTLSRQQVLEEDLSGALLQFRRRATQVGQLEDWYIFNGTYPGDSPMQPPAAPQGVPAPLPHRRLPSYQFLDDLVTTYRILIGGPNPVADHRTMIRGLIQRDPGSLGLMHGAQQVRDKGRRVIWAKRGSLDKNGLMRVIVQAMNVLEEHGYVAPYACVLGRLPFEEAHDPVGESITYPRDRIEPLIGRELLHASALDVLPRTSRQYDRNYVQRYRSRGVLLSLNSFAVDLAIAAEATPEFRYVDAEGRYIFSVFERFAVRIKDPRAIVPLLFY